MAVAAYDLDFYLSGAASHGGAQPDPNAALGAYRSSTKLDSIESTFTAIAAAGALRLVDSARIGDGVGAHVGKWLLILSGSNAVTYASRITAFDTTTGGLGVFTALPLAVAVGDYYRIFSPNNLFDDVSATEAAAGDVEYRMIYGKNAMGSALQNARYYLELVEPGGIELALVADDHATASDQWQPAIADESTPPNLSGFWGSAAFTRPLAYGGSQQPPNDVDPANGCGAAIWLRRTIPLNSHGIALTIFKLVVEGTNPVLGAALIVFGVAGFTPTIEVTRDRKTYVGGGGRITATLSAIETGNPVAGEPVAWSLAAGPGTLYFAGDEETDAVGESAVVYEAPTAEAHVGASVTIAAEA